MFHRFHWLFTGSLVHWLVGHPRVPGFCRWISGSLDFCFSGFPAVVRHFCNFCNSAFLGSADNCDPTPLFCDTPKRWHHFPLEWILLWSLLFPWIAPPPNHRNLPSFFATFDCSLSPNSVENPFTIWLNCCCFKCFNSASPTLLLWCKQKSNAYQFKIWPRKLASTLYFCTLFRKKTFNIRTMLNSKTFLFEALFFHFFGVPEVNFFVLNSNIHLQVLLL